jgi:hypothetical protein
MHYRSPVPRKDSEFQGATPLHLQARVPASATYSAVPTAGHASGPDDGGTPPPGSSAEHKQQSEDLGASAPTAVTPQTGMETAGVPPPQHEGVPPGGHAHAADDAEVQEAAGHGHPGHPDSHRQAWDAWASQDHMVRLDVLCVWACVSACAAPGRVTSQSHLTVVLPLHSR